MRIGIDASNVGGGGGITHLREILSYVQHLDHEVDSVVVFASQKVLDQLPEDRKIRKKTFPALNKGLFERVLFQIFRYDKQIKKNCDILFAVTGDYIGRFKPVVGMSRNMLLYERDIWKEIRQPKEIIRFWLNYQKQRRSFKKSAGIIFISNYASNYIPKWINISRKNTTVINHGVSPRFKGQVKIQKAISEYSLHEPFKLLYVSTVHVYKHQWNVVKAVGNLRKQGFPIELNLVGGVIFPPAGRRLDMVIQDVDPKNEFIHNHGHISYDNIERFYQISDGIVYASTCENMPNILIESMASGVPIACSQKQPMPEFLKENGFYFDSHDIASIEEAIKRLIMEPQSREVKATNSIKEAARFSWEQTSHSTFNTLIEMFKTNNNVQK